MAKMGKQGPDLTSPSKNPWEVGGRSDQIAEITAFNTQQIRHEVRGALRERKQMISLLAHLTDQFPRPREGARAWLADSMS